MKHWEEAIAMKEEHMDTLFNYHLYKWRVGILSDDQLIDVLREKGVFSQGGGIGDGLQGILKLAIGEIAEGTALLEGVLLGKGGP